MKLPLASILLLANSLLYMGRIAVATLVDNGVIGDPEVQCNADSVSLNFKSEKNFEGHVYVKGHYDDAGCRQDASSSVTTIFNVSFSNCGVRRQRSTNPSGIFITTTVVISFHPIFITKVDRAYAIRCFYMAADKVVTVDLNVRHNEIGVESLGVVNDGNKDAIFGSLESQLTTHLITQNIPMPVCRYEVLDNGPSGTVVKYAVVGQLVYHKWTCEGEYASSFCMTVHSCTADDGHGKKFPLLDEHGCAQDRYLMENLNYTNDMSGGVESHVFKYADKPSLFFQCQIRLNVKEENKCQRTSENCPSIFRGKRAAILKNLTSYFQQKKANQIYSRSNADSYDVFSDPMVVIDVDEGTVAMKQFDHDPELSPQLLAKNGVFIGSKLCLSTTTFGAMLSAFILLLFALLLSCMISFIKKSEKLEQNH